MHTQIMSHRKVRSQGSIPFSWETEPGVCKADIPPFIDDKPTISNSPNKGSVTLRKLPIPPPPCKNGPYLRHVSLGRPIDDPFLVAFKECTRVVAPLGNQKKNVEKYSNSMFGFRSMSKSKSKSIFSCKSSCDIREDNFVNLSRLPPLPKGRSRSTIVQ